MSTFHEMKAEPMTTGQLDRWLSGKIPRRHLALPFGGPVTSPTSAKGVDADLEFFDERTDFYGPYPTLRKTRDRLVDWHHVTFGDRSDPTGVMKGSILGRIALDDEPSEEEVDGIAYAGVWCDFWANAGERKRVLLAQLERRHVPLYGSSQPVQKGVLIDKDTGHIEVWPVRYHTITTSPQNTHAVLPPMKALLDDSLMAGLPVGALAAFLTGSDDPELDLRAIAGDPTGSLAQAGAKAGRVLSAVNEKDIEEALAGLVAGIDNLRRVMDRSRKEDT